MKLVRVAFFGGCALLAVCVGVARASGGGGATIAAAPAVVSGVQEVGNTSVASASCGHGFDFWKLQLEQGDSVDITWGSTSGADELALWPADTTDAAYGGPCVYDATWSGWSVKPLQTATNPAPGTRLTSHATAGTDGTYPLLFVDTSGSNAGAYSFTAVVRHEAIVGLPQATSIDGAGTVIASVAAPDSDLITDSSLTLTLNGYWSSGAGKPPTAHVLATATPTNGTASFGYSLPPELWGKTIKLGISGGGTNYQDVTTPQEAVKVLVTTGAAVAARATALKTASKLLHQPIYWAGPHKRFQYEFTRLAKGWVYVRYLPRGVKVGDPRPNFLIVATYPLHRAYVRLRKYAHGQAVKGPHGSIYYVEPVAPTNVYVAFPKINYEIEIFDPSPALARKLASSGRIRPVR